MLLLRFDISSIINSPICAIIGIACMLYFVFGSDDKRRTFNELKVCPKKYAALMLDWCQTNMIGSVTSKVTVLIDYESQPKDGRYGEFDPNTNQIRIFMKKHFSIFLFTEIFIHEYTHAQQFFRDGLAKYDSFTQRYGTYDNPYEKEARAMELIYAANCYNELLCKIK
jgi:hypothetical protein